MFTGVWHLEMDTHQIQVTAIPIESTLSSNGLATLWMRQNNHRVLEFYGSVAQLRQLVDALSAAVAELEESSPKTVDTK